MIFFFFFLKEQEKLGIVMQAYSPGFRGSGFKSNLSYKVRVCLKRTRKKKPLRKNPKKGAQRQPCRGPGSQTPCCLDPTFTRWGWGLKPGPAQISWKGPGSLLPSELAGKPRNSLFPSLFSCQVWTWAPTSRCLLLNIRHRILKGKHSERRREVTSPAT